MQRLVEAGELTEEEAEQSERRNIILQALGPDPRVKVDLTYLPLRRGDLIILCSDGLSGQVKKEEIAEVARSTSDLAQLCAKLIDLANERGGPDNITAVAVRFEGEALPDRREKTTPGTRCIPSARLTRPPSRYPFIPVARLRPRSVGSRRCPGGWWRAVSWPSGWDSTSSSCAAKPPGGR
jgi:Serine/threonine protein phosphatase